MQDVSEEMKADIHLVTTPTPKSNLEYALAYAAIGWYVFPVWGAKDGKCRCGKECKSPGKHPVEHLVSRGQDDATTDPATIRRWYLQDPHAGIALFLKKSGLCAIDIDPRNGGTETIETIESKHGALTSDVLAFTQGGGEHRVFKLCDSLQLPGKLGDGVDVKRNGYIVIEPSKGVRGVYLWEASSDPLNGAIPSPLPDWIRDLTREAAAPATSVGEECRFISPEQVAELKEALSYIQPDDYHTWINVGQALRSIGYQGFGLWDTWSKTSEKYDAAEMGRRWRGFKPGAYNLESIFHLAQKAGWLNPLSGGVDKPSIIIESPYVSGDNQPSLPPRVTTPPELLTIPVPMLQCLVDWMENFSEEPNRQISVHAALALAAVVGGRSYVSEGGNVSGAYFVTLAGTGVGKNYCKHAIRQLLCDSGFDGMLSGSGNTSAGAVFTALFKAPNHIQISDEFGKQLAMARRQNGGAMADAFAVMTEAYSDATGTLVPRNYSAFNLTKAEIGKLDTKIVQSPCITLFSFATPEQVFDNLTTAEIDDGFLNRLVVMQVTEPALAERRIGDKRTPQAAIDWIQGIRRAVVSGTSIEASSTPYDAKPNPTIVKFTAEAWAVFDSFKREIKTSSYAEPKLAIRWRENAMRLATSLAIASYPGEQIVSAKLAEWAVSYIRYHGTAFMLSAISKIADNDFHRIYLAVKEKIGHADQYGVTERELANRCRAFARTPTGMRKQVLEALTREEFAAYVQFKPQSGRGRPRNSWVAIDKLSINDCTSYAAAHTDETQ